MVFLRKRGGVNFGKNKRAGNNSSGPKNDLAWGGNPERPSFGATKELAPEEHGNN